MNVLSFIDLLDQLSCIEIVMDPRRNLFVVDFCFLVLFLSCFKRNDELSQLKSGRTYTVHPLSNIVNGRYSNTLLTYIVFERRIGQEHL